jgi:hypothetical protein
MRDRTRDRKALSVLSTQLERHCAIAVIVGIRKV